MSRHDIIYVIPLLALLAIGGGAVVYFLRRLRRFIVENFSRRLTRLQHSAFEIRLRELIFRDPFRYMNMLCSKEAEWFVTKLWEETGDVCARPSLPGGAAARLMESQGSAAPHPIRLPAEGIGVELFRMHDGLVLAVVKFPEPKFSGEAYFAGILLPADPTLSSDINRARQRVRYFVLNRFEGNRNTDFCEWKVNGRQLTYNIGAPKYPEGFAKAIEARREYELRRRRRVG